MTYQALARKWRPHRFEELVGQAHVVKALTNALDQGRVHHAFLFTGTRGVGKTTVARILAKCLNCERGVSSTPCGECAACLEIDQGRHPDLIEVDAASRAKVDETRDLMNNVQFAPTRGRHKVYLIDEVHMFSDASFNALLKTLEEPPPHVKFLLATTDPQRMPVTVLSRCLQFSLKRLPADQIVARLDEILGAESVPFDPAALRMLARAADGSLRDALSLLDQAIAHGGGDVQAEPVRAMLGLLDRGHVHALVERLAAADGAGLLGAVDAMSGDVADFGEALAELLGALKQIAVAQAVPDALSDDDEAGWVREMSARLPPEDVQLYYQIGLIGRRDLPLAPDPRTGFEMTLLRMLAFAPDGQPGAGARPGAAARPARGGETAASGAVTAAGEPDAVTPSPDGASPPAAAPRGRPAPRAPVAAVVAPTGAPAMSAPSGAPAMSAPTGAPAMSAPAGAPAMSAPAGAPAMSVPAGAPAMSVPTGAPAMSAPTGAPATSAPTGAPATSATTGAPATSAPAGVPATSPPTGAPATPPPARGAEQADAAGAVTLEPARWAEVVSGLVLSGLARELASNCELAGTDGPRVVLRLAPEHRQLAAGRGPKRLEKALSERLGREVTVQLEIAERSADTPAEIARREHDHRRALAASELERDPGVSAILDAFGGSIEPDSIRPVDR